ncbi:hypothetical protein LY76DRAFT_644041 [Colletotrichum caudatum]|nr:hypothetical protein LY76DRAFT_644041 [Colletotrichum caudatum]
MTRVVIKAAAANEESGKDIMALLLDKRGDNIQITKEIVKAAAENWGNGQEIMALLLDKCGDDIQITKEIVRAAADKEERAKSLINDTMRQNLLAPIQFGDEICLVDCVLAYKAYYRLWVRKLGGV